jgi:hypothetical protein
MKICLCFIGLQRTIQATVQNIIQSFLLHPTAEISILYVTWDTENTDCFKSFFPSSHIIKVPTVSMCDQEFQDWKENLQMHISWRRTYEPTVALFRYYQQIYLWKKAAEILQTYQIPFDILARLRTDVVYSSPIYPLYESIMNGSTQVYFPDYKDQHILLEGECCSDQFFIGKYQPVLKTLEILDYIDLYKINYVERKRKWFPEDTFERNIVQPESTLYYFLVGEKISFAQMDMKIEVIR